MGKPEVSVIISTYNKPDYLKLVLFSYQLQTLKNFEVVIADDGSSLETKKVIDEFVKTSDFKLKHVWHEDKGFRKCKILNKAIMTSEADYLIFSDGDCLARQDFIETHLNLRAWQYALSGGYFKLTKEVSSSISEQHILSQKCFEPSWLITNGQPRSFKMNKLTRNKFKAKLLNNITTTKATFDGMNVSLYKQHLLDVNGFDERMTYGGLDREVGERLMNCGLKFKQIRYSAICLHLYHDRPYKNEETLRINQKIRNQTKNQKLERTNYGIRNRVN